MLKPLTVLVLVLGAAVVAGCGDQIVAPETSGISAGGLTPLASSRGARFEPGFLTNLIDLEQAGLDMARLAPGRAAHPEVEALALEMASDMAAEIGTLQGMLLTWYGVSYTPAAGSGGRLASLTGDDFEEAFLTKMVRYDDQVISSARQGIAKAEHTSLLALCMDIAEARYAEKALLKSWNCAWYGNCR